MDVVHETKGPVTDDRVPESIADHVTVVPAEQVSLHLVTLPVRSARQRRAGLPFALEEAVGEGLDSLHFAICDMRPDGTILAAVIEKAVMDKTITGRPDAPVVPEQMLLAPPAQGSCWATLRTEDRVLVRASDGTGFVVHVNDLEHLWRISGQPNVINHAQALPPSFEPANRPIENWLGPSDLAAFDLRQGGYRPSLGLERPMKWLAASVAVAVVGHFGLAMADIQAQTALADSLRQDAAMALQARMPDARPDDDPALVQRKIAARFAPQNGSGFLPLMDAISRAWVRDGAPIDIQQLSWSDDVLQLVVEAPDLEALQRAEASLATDGLSVSSGSATADAGSARAEFLVRE